MSNERFYPKVDPTIIPVFRAIQVNLASTPEYLDFPECPYTDEIKELIRNLTRATAHDLGIDPALLAGADAPNIFGAGDKWEIMQSQTELLYSSLMALKNKIDVSQKTDKTVTFYKTLVSTMERLITVGERVTQAKDVHDFKRRVLSAVDTLLDPQQRQELIRLLEQE